VAGTDPGLSVDSFTLKTRYDGAFEVIEIPLLLILNNNINNNITTR